MKQLGKAVERGALPMLKGANIVGLQSAPFFTQPLLSAIPEDGDCVVVTAGSMRFNHLHDKMREGRFTVSEALYLQTLKTNPILFDWDLIKNKEVVTIMDQHQLRWLDYLVDTYPAIRFAFLPELVSAWKAHKKGRLIEQMSYTRLTKRYGKRSLPLHESINPRVMLQKDRIHLNQRGRLAFAKLVLRY